MQTCSEQIYHNTSRFDNKAAATSTPHTNATSIAGETCVSDAAANKDAATNDFTLATKASAKV
ncbi:unnamed protein product [Mucor fragilis]